MNHSEALITPTCIALTFAIILFSFASPTIGLSQDDSYVELLFASSRKLLSAIKSLEVECYRRMEYPQRKQALTSKARIRLSGEKARADVVSEVYSLGLGEELSQDTKITQDAWAFAYDGEKSYKLPSSEPLFSVYHGNQVVAVKQFIPGMHYNAMRFDKWLEMMKLSYKGPAKNSEIDGSHCFTGLRYKKDVDNKDELIRRFEIIVSDKYGFAVVGYKIYNTQGGKNALLAEYKASSFRQFDDNIWLPEKAESLNYHIISGELTKLTSYELKYVHVNRPVDEEIFKLYPPSDYAIADKTTGIFVQPENLRLPMDVDILPNSTNHANGESRKTAVVVQHPAAESQQPASKNTDNSNNDRAAAFAGKHAAHSPSIALYSAITVLALILMLAAGVLLGKAIYSRKGT